MYKNLIDIEMAVVSESEIRNSAAMRLYRGESMILEWRRAAVEAAGQRGYVLVRVSNRQRLIEPLCNGAVVVLQEPAQSSAAQDAAGAASEISRRFDEVVSVTPGTEVIPEDTDLLAKASGGVELALVEPAAEAGRLDGEASNFPRLRLEEAVSGQILATPLLESSSMTWTPHMIRNFELTLCH